jgi:hypothetical protein
MRDMKGFIVRTFKELLNMKVRVINLPEEEIDMGIYVVHDKRTAKMKEKELATFMADYAITRLNPTSNQWIHMIAVHSEGIVRNGEVEAPPDSDFKESQLTFNHSELALRDLVVELIKDRFDDLLMCQEEMEEVY